MVAAVGEEAALGGMDARQQAAEHIPFPRRRELDIEVVRARLYGGFGDAGGVVDGAGGVDEQVDALKRLSEGVRVGGIDAPCRCVEWGGSGLCFLLTTSGQDEGGLCLLAKEAGDVQTCIAIAAEDQNTGRDGFSVAL